MPKFPNYVRSIEMDSIDKQIIQTLIADGRIANNQLAEQIGIAPSTCLTRVRALETNGVIKGFTALISRKAQGLNLEALISVSIRAGARQTISEFSEHIKNLEAVIQVFFLGGAEDFIIHVAVVDSDSLRDFVVKNLSAHPSVASTRTSIIFENYLRNHA
jgi:DNA-binding Lrp family transcriptional regulator